MLKITLCRDPSATTFRLEGRLAGPWVRELEDSWQAESPGANPTLRVDLTGVTFIDAAGRALLARMYRHGAEFVAVECMTRAVIDDITGKEERFSAGNGPVPRSGSQPLARNL